MHQQVVHWFDKYDSAAIAFKGLESWLCLAVMMSFDIIECRKFVCDQTISSGPK